MDKNGLLLTLTPVIGQLAAKSSNEEMIAIFISAMGKLGKISPELAGISSNLTQRDLNLTNSISITSRINYNSKADVLYKLLLFYAIHSKIQNEAIDKKFIETICGMKISLLETIYNHSYKLADNQINLSALQTLNSSEALLKLINSKSENGLICFENDKEPAKKIELRHLNQKDKSYPRLSSFISGIITAFLLGAIGLVAYWFLQPIANKLDSNSLQLSISS